MEDLQRDVWLAFRMLRKSPIFTNVPELPAPAAISMEETMNESLASERILAMLAGFFGTLALIITGIGLSRSDSFAFACGEGDTC